MNTNDQLIKKTFIGIWIVAGTSMLFGIACVMIDAIMTGQFLGSKAVAATGLVQPVTILINMVGGLFGPGLAVVCTRYMGMAKKDKVNQVFSLVMTVLFILMVVLACLLFVFSPAIASTLGARSDDPDIIQMAADYLRGFAFAALPMCISMSLAELMMLDNDRQRAMGSMLATLLCDFLFDYLNVAVFYGGMFGMAIATALSNVAGLLVVLSHFTKKERVLRYSFPKMDMGELKEVILCGIPNAVSLGSLALKSIFFNTFLLTIASEVELSGLSAACSFFSIMNAVGLGLFNTTSSLASLLFGEGDGNSIVRTYTYSKKIIIRLFGVLMVILLLLANFVARGFLDPSATKELLQAARFIRFMAVQYFFFALSYTLSGVYQSIMRNGYSYLLVALREGILPVVCCLALGNIFGISGFEKGFIVSGVLMLIITLLLPSAVNKRFSLKAEDMVLMPEGITPREDELFEASVGSMDQVSAVSEQAREFCLKRNMKKRDANMTALFLEENIINILTHGSDSGKPINVDVRVINRNDNLIIRFRDNGRPFDPVEWYEKNHPEDPTKGLGIRIIVGLATDVKYIPAMGLNNLVLTLF